jgi:putative FmdB family regulatory protein
MPIYEYECQNCHHHYELMQKIIDEPATQCPKCFHNSAVRLVSAAGFQLKGSGWYATDFKNKPSDKSKSASSSDASHSKPDTTSTETKSTADKPKTNKE